MDACTGRGAQLQSVSTSKNTTVYGIPPALHAAYKLLQHNPHLAATPAALSSNSSRGSHTSCHQHQHQQLKSGVHVAAAQLSSIRQQHQHGNLQHSRVCCLPDSTADSADLPDAAGSSGTASCTSSSKHTPSAAPGQASPAAEGGAAAAAALSRLQQVLQRLPRQSQSPSGPSGTSSSSSEPGGQLLLQPVRPLHDPAAVQQAHEQQEPARQDRLLSWRSRRAGAAANVPSSPPQHQDAAQSQQQPQQPRAVQQDTAAAGTLQHQQHHHQQQQQLPAPALEPSFVDGRAYVTSPVSVVAASTATRRLAGSISAAFLLHTHQLMFAVGPQPLGIAIKALATARRMLAEDNSGQPANILMQPTLRGGRTPRQQSYALDIMRVGTLPMQPGVTGRQQLAGEDAGADARLVHITSSSNEVAAARSLVENMPARGQTVMRVMGPYATETAVLAVALARPLMQARWGQDLAVLVMWNDHRATRSKHTGLLLSVFRCEQGSFPPRVLLQPVSRRVARRMEHGRRHKQELERRVQGQVQQQVQAQ